MNKQPVDKDRTVFERCCIRAGPLRSALLLAPLAGPGIVQESGPVWGDLFSVDGGLAVWTVLTFVTLLAILGRFAWKPMLSVLSAREEGIQRAIDEAGRQRQEAETLLVRHREQLAEAQRQAQALMAESRSAAEALRKELEAQARADAQALVESAKREIERERTAAIDAVRRESVDVALAVASRILGEKLDGERDRRLTVEFIESLVDSGSARA